MSGWQMYAEQLFCVIAQILFGGLVFYLLKPKVMVNDESDVKPKTCPICGEGKMYLEGKLYWCDNCSAKIKHESS